jgi:hypothetical protein
VASNEDELRHAINNYLNNPDLDRQAQKAFVKQECTFTDGTAGQCTGAFLLSIA